jgi:phosphoglycerate dehydrogenase-like enzyme
MKNLNIVVVNSVTHHHSQVMEEQFLEQIEAVAPGIRVTDASSIASAEKDGDTKAREKMDTLLATADILVGFVPQNNLFQRAPHVKWVQMLSAGVDSLTGSEIWQSDIPITGVSGIHAAPIGEYVLMTMQMFAKQSPRGLRQQQKHDWKRYTPRLLKAHTVGIIGLGHIGREIARLAKAFGMEVLAVDELRGTKPARNVDRMIPPDRLIELFKESDYVVSSVPLTPKTHNLIGKKQLKAMKKSAYLINISRGGIVDEDALVKALKDKRIAGAGLDVTAREPLPPDSPLWSLDNVILTPHVSGGQEDYIRLATALFCENLRRYIAGKKLINLVNRKRGY